MIRSPLLGGVQHGFLGRAGGVSEGIVASLNVGFGATDDREAVLVNRRLAADAIAPDARLVTAYQVHSPTCVVVEQPWPDDRRPEADAMVTDRPGLLLGIITADCAPVLLADEKAGVIGAAHAGWRGAVGGVTDRTIAAMLALGAARDDIQAVVGPCIAQQSYEVSEDFRSAVLDENSDNDRFFADGPSGKPHFDLPAYIIARLIRAGISAADAVRLDTYAHADRFYSYRRSTHRDEETYGRQLSGIALP